MNACRPKMPGVLDSEIVSRNFKHKEKVPFIFSEDTEGILKSIEKEQQGQGNTKAVRVQQHEPFSMAYHLKCSYDDSVSGFSTVETAPISSVARLWYDKPPPGSAKTAQTRQQIVQF